MDVERIKRKYRRNARFYDALLRRPTQRLREKAIGRLALQPGETVFDLGCGTGLSFDALERAVGPQGHITGLEVSPDMLARAKEKVARHGWTNVTLLEADAEEAGLEPESADAVLCFYTHDILNSRRALERALAALRPGGRFVAAGGKRASGPHGVLLNLATFAYSLPFITNLSGTAHPWTHLEHLLGPLDVEEHLWGSAYIAHGVRGATKGKGHRA